MSEEELDTTDLDLPDETEELKKAKERHKKAVSALTAFGRLSLQTYQPDWALIEHALGTGGG